MTETAIENGPGDTQTTAPGTTVIVDEGSNNEAGIKVAGPLTEDNRAMVENHKWAEEDTVDLNKILDSHKNLRAHADKAVTVPGENATQEDWDKLWTRLGRPENADGYELKLNTEAIPENFPYDEGSAVEFRNWAHETGLAPRQAQQLHDKFVGFQAAQFEQQQQVWLNQEQEATRELAGDWGSPDGEEFQRQATLMGRAAKNFGVMDELKSVGLLSDDNAVRSPKLAKMLARIGAELFSEDDFSTGGGGVLNNPFAQGENFSLSKASALVKSDPRKAAALAKSAGANLKDFGLEKYK